MLLPIQVSGGKFGLLDPVIDGFVESVKVRAQLVVPWRRARHDTSQAWSEKPRMGAREEERSSNADFRHPIAMRAGNPFNEPMQSQPPKVIRHLALGHVTWLKAK